MVRDSNRQKNHRFNDFKFELNYFALRANVHSIALGTYIET